MKKWLTILCLIMAVLMLTVCVSGCGCSSSSSSSYSSSDDNDEKQGFVGSDGEYHAYVPEFGDDVNNWMEENW